MKLKYGLVLLFASLMGCTRDLSKIEDGSYTDQEVSQMIEQLEGRACHWNSSGHKVGLFDRWLTISSSFDGMCKNDAALLLAKAGPKAKPAVPSLIKLIEDQTKTADIADSTEWHGSIRATSALALGKIGDPRAIDGLIALFESNKHISDSSTPNYRQSAPYRQQEAIRALGEIGVRRPDVINVLLQGLNNQDDEVKASSAKALGQLRVEQAIVPVTKLLKNQSDRARCEAATGACHLCKVSRDQGGLRHPNCCNSPYDS